jgi:L-methionine (R)-S-oxide reductase
LKKDLFDTLLEKIEEIVKGEDSRGEKLQRICNLLCERVSHYDWVGFYLVNPEKERELVLGPFVGDPTDHVNIQFGEGICGQSAETKKIFVVQDVSQVTNYLACSPTVQSEIVVPILRGKEFLGELDIDSHLLAPFTKHDERFLEAICELVVDIL